jgi:hypothetical protein
VLPTVQITGEAWDLRNSVVHHVKNENPQSPNQHAQQRNPPGQKLAQRHFSRRAPCRSQDGEVGAAMRADFCRLIDLFIALGAGIHELVGRLFPDDASHNLPFDLTVQRWRQALSSQLRMSWDRDSIQLSRVTVPCIGSRSMQGVQSWAG